MADRARDTALVFQARRNAKRAAGQLRAIVRDLTRSLEHDERPDVVGHVDVADSPAELRAATDLIVLAARRHGRCTVVVLADPRP